MLLMYGQHGARKNQIGKSTQDLSGLEFHAGSYKFWGSDSEQQFLYFSKILPKHHEWHKWQDIPVNYTVNSQHYRSPEWQDINWNDSVLILGCSQVFGTGLDDSQTISHNLQNISNLNIVNLGVPAASPMLQWVNTTILKQHNIKPLAVIYIWTYPERVSALNGDQLALHSGPWNGTEEPLFYGWNYHSNHSIEYLRYAISSTGQQWESVNCPVLHYTFCDKTKQHLDFLEFLNPKMDLARDRQHVGPQTTKKWAETIHQKLKSELESKV